MSILNRPSDGLFNVLIVLIRCSMSLGPMPRAKLLDLCAPKSLVGDKQEMAIKTLNRWTQLGLFVPDDEQTAICDAARQILRKQSVSNSAIVQVVRSLVMAKENVVNFWEEEGNRAADFCRAAAWLLAQDVYSFTPSSYSEVESRSDEQTISGKSIFRGDVTWPGYASWSAFLGFGRPDSGSASRGHIIDPTPAIRQQVLDTVGEKGDIPVNELLNRLAEQVPVIDGGEYRQMVEEHLRQDKWRAPGEGALSMSLSRSLLRMREAGEIRLEAKSDADSEARLLGRNYKVIQIVTHVKRGAAR